MKNLATKLGLYFLLPCLLAFFAVALLSWVIGGPDEALGGPVAFAIIFFAAFPIVALALLSASNPQALAMTLLGGSLIKVCVVVVLTLWVRAQRPEFADKKSFLIWLLLSYLIVSSLGWFVCRGEGANRSGIRRC